MGRSRRKEEYKEVEEDEEEVMRFLLVLRL